MSTGNLDLNRQVRPDGLIRLVYMEGVGLWKKKNGGIAGEAAVQALMFHLVLQSAPKEELSGFGFRSYRQELI